jgi:hypothetical protein
MLLGTPSYMSPEACEGGDITALSDLYSLGVTLFACLTGRLPFLSKTVPGLLLAHVTKPPPRASELEPAVPAALDAVIERLLAKRPEARYPTATDVVAALEAILPELPKGPASGGDSGPLVVLGGNDSPGVDLRAGDLAGAPGAKTVVMRRGTILGAAVPDEAPGLTVEELVLRAQLFCVRENWTEAERDLGAALARAPAHSGARFLSACVLARLGRADDAIQALERAVESGFGDASRIRTANAFQSLRGDDRFQAILDALEKESA